MPAADTNVPTEPILQRDVPELTQAEQAIRIEVYGEEGATLVRWLERNNGESLTGSVLTEILPDTPIDKSRAILQATLEIMSGIPEYIGRVQKRPEGGRGGYKPVLLPEEERIEALEDVLTLTAFQLYEAVKQSVAGLPIGAAIQAVAVKRGKKPDFAQVQSAIQQLQDFFGESFQVQRNTAGGHIVLRVVSEDEQVYSRHKAVK